MARRREPRDADQQERRDFLVRCGRFAAVTPPAMTMLLAVAAKPIEAHASTVQGNGWGGRKRKGKGPDPG
jgi:hypothetical protein